MDDLIKEKLQLPQQQAEGTRLGHDTPQEEKNHGVENALGGTAPYSHQQTRKKRENRNEGGRINPCVGGAK